MRRLSRRGLAWVLVATTAFALGCAATRPQATARPAPPAGADTLSAPALYRSLCAHCHGPDATGYAADDAPSLVNPTFLASASDAFLQHSIEWGRPGTSMGAYAKSAGGPLDPAAVGRLVAWLRSHGGLRPEIMPVTAGDPARGRALYDTHCERCHGSTARRGNAVRIESPGFLAVATDAFIQYAIVSGRPGTPMVSFRDSLDASEIADIVAHLRSLARPIDDSRLPPPTGKEPLFAYPKGHEPNFTPRDGRFVGVEQADHALEQHRKFVIVDARPESEWRTSHITGAVSIPYYQLARLGEIPKSAWVVAYCACPHHLSGVVVDSLRSRGYPHAYVLDEGIVEWERRGYPMVAAPGAAVPGAPAPVVR